MVRCFTCALAALPLVFASTALADFPYTLTILPSFGGGNMTIPEAINSSGQITGRGSSSTQSIPDRGFLYSEGAMIDLGLPIGASPKCDPYAIDDAGMIAGYMSVNSTSYVFTWSHGVFTKTLSPVGPTIEGINSSGKVVGTSGPSSSRHAYVLSNQVFTDLGTLGGNMSFAYAINDAGQIVGSSQDLYGIMRSFLYSNGSMTMLPIYAASSVNARAINELGHIAGDAQNAELSRAFIYREGVVTYLNDFSIRGTVSAMNDFDEVVGTFGGKPCIYKNGAYTDLNTLVAPVAGWTIYEVKDINNAGQITGTLRDGFGNFLGYVITPVPEPASLAVFLLGAGALCRRRTILRESRRRIGAC